MSSSDVAKRLAERAEEVCRYLLPNGKRRGAEWCCGSVEGEEGNSLKVSLRGENAGLWADFGNDQYRGDLLDLWAHTKGVTIGEAFKQARAYLGIPQPGFDGHRSKSYRRPEKPRVSKPRDVELDYLSGERKLSTETIAAFKIGAAEEEICFPYLRDGELIAAKYLRIQRQDGKKIMRMEKDCEPCLFGWQAIPDGAREVTICEGEIDAMSLWQMGKPALSVPNGATGHSWIEHEFDNLERFDTVYLCFDNDEPGSKGAREVADRLGLHRCRIVEIPKPWKDANDILRAGLNSLQIMAFFDKAKTIDPEELRGAASFVEDVIREFHYTEDAGYLPPWQKLHRKFRFRPGELTVLAGTRGHGKSEGVGNITLDVMKQGGKACVASMEFVPRKWIKRMTRQCAGVELPSEDYIRAIHRWYEDKLWAFVASGPTKASRILEIFNYARRRYACDFFVVDNLAKCGFGEDDYNEQKTFVDKLCDFARDNNVHVILVHHMRKGSYDEKPGDDMDVKGTGGITDMADNVVIWWRNKAKEDKRRDAEKVNLDFDEGSEIDAQFKCTKQRNGEHEPRAGLFFHQGSHQFVESPGQRPKIYVHWSGTQEVAA